MHNYFLAISSAAESQWRKKWRKNARKPRHDWLLL